MYLDVTVHHMLGDDSSVSPTLTRCSVMINVSPEVVCVQRMEVDAEVASHFIVEYSITAA